MAELGDFLADSNQKTVELPAEDLMVPISIAIEDDSEIEADGRIGVSIVSGNGYNVAAQPDNSATANVLDNDAPSGISIQSVDNIIEEGETAVFQVISATQLLENLDVSVSITQVGDFIDNTPISQVVTLQPNSRIEEVSVEVPDDTEWEIDGEITA